MRDGCLDDNTIAAFFRGSLSPKELAGIDAHIDRCADCRVLLSSLAAREMSVGPFSATEFSSRRQRELLDEPDTAPATAESARLSTGEVLADRFVIEGRVGAGGMAEVYRAHDRERGAKVAIKVPLGAAPQDSARFEREARLLVQLSHPAIVKHTANGRLADATPFLAMEWLEGVDLAERLHRGPMGIDDTLLLGARIAGALAAAHASGAVHRDIKPSNIFLRDGTVRGATLIDFGVARHALRETGSLATRTGMLLGTLGYMAPEQALGAKTADARADVFSLGCVLFECVSGRRLFAGAHAVEILAKLLTEPVPPLRTLAPHVPAALEALVARMLLRNPAERPSDCAAIAADLERIRAAGPDPIANARAPQPVATRSSRRRAIGVGALAAVAVMAGGGAIWRSRANANTNATATATSTATATATATSTPTDHAVTPTPARDATAAPTGRVAADVSTPPRAPRAKPAPLAPPADPFGNSRN